MQWFDYLCFAVCGFHLVLQFISQKLFKRKITCLCNKFASQSNESDDIYSNGKVTLTSAQLNALTAFVLTLRED